MVMKHKLLITFLILLTGQLIAYSQENDKQAVDLLNEVNKKMDSYTSFKLEFNLYIEDLHDASRNSYSGSAMYKEGYYRLDLMGQIIFSDGTNNWTYLTDADEVNITDNVDEDDNLIDPKNLLKDFEKEYKVRLISDKFERNRPLVEIDLYPIDIRNKKYSRIVLKVDKSKNQIFSVRQVGKDGVSYLVEFFRFIENPDIPDNKIKFSADKFPNAEIIDMRY